MKISHLTIIGIVLLAGAMIAAAWIQFFGSGLVVTEHVNRHIQSSNPHVMFAVTKTTTYYVLRILSLLAVALVGVLFLLLSRRYRGPIA